LKEQYLNPTAWGTRFGRGYGPKVRQTTWCWCMWTTVSVVMYSLLLQFVERLIHGV